MNENTLDQIYKLILKIDKLSELFPRYINSFVFKINEWHYKVYIILPINLHQKFKLCRILEELYCLNNNESYQELMDIIYDKGSIIEVGDQNESYNVPLIFNSLIKYFPRLRNIKYIIQDKGCSLVDPFQEITIDDCRKKYMETNDKLKYYFERIIDLEMRCDHAYTKSIIGKMRRNTIIDEEVWEKKPEVIETYKELEKLKTLISNFKN
jgi:hypothetical protein